VAAIAVCFAGQLLIVMGVEGDDLTAAHKQFIRDLSSPQLTVEYRTVPDIKIKNEFSPRFGLNWIKLNSWNMTEFDTVINLDTGAHRKLSTHKSALSQQVLGCEWLCVMPMFVHMSTQPVVGTTIL
jgi:hypothetical protein